MFLNTFHREHILLKLKTKKLLRKIKSKNLTAGVFVFFFFFFSTMDPRYPISFVKLDPLTLELLPLF